MFINILHNETGQKVHENYIHDFSEKSLICAKLAVLGLKMTRPHLDIKRHQKIPESYINGFSYKIVMKGGAVTLNSIKFSLV